MPFNLNRREFLRDMGLLGLGATTASLGPIAAFGEDWGDKATINSRPFYVKEVDTPTVEIDWAAIYRFNERDTVRRGLAKYVGEDEATRITGMRESNQNKFALEGRPGYSIRDIAMYAASGIGATQSFLPPDNISTPEDRGVPRWEGTPEENSEMIRSALRAFGAATVGFVELEEETTKKLIYSIDPDGKELVFKEQDQPEEDETTRVIPNKCRYVIVWTVQMSAEQLQRAPTPLGAATTSLAYSQNRAIQSRLQGFLRSIGYLGLGENETNALGIAPAFGVMAGLGELSRLNRLVTPEYGPMVRVFKMVTDLPVAPTKPINAGIMNFCKTCKTCATYCPSGSLSLESEPSYETQGGWNRGGVKTWYENSVTCRTYWGEVGTNCGICFSVCPFAVKNKALIHSMVKGVIGTTPIFDSALASMSRTAYISEDLGQPQKDCEEWWKLDYSELGYDTTMGHQDA
ncbi:MAG TPA: reductive dehalogenase [Aggregatilinea sp.]|uniref:reductive dehalogenase n=1 Tax=Aggregatilinea TaxID=2806306 RepID=UPI000E5C045F|nr:MULTISPECIES: reductive dehalogenase [Aggregatilinea]HML22394.1 reductive dehalogenase [Aggregatilinea sp.]